MQNRYFDHDQESESKRHLNRYENLVRVYFCDVESEGEEIVREERGKKSMEKRGKNNGEKKWKK